MRKYPQRFAIRVDAYTVAASWLSLAWFVAALFGSMATAVISETADITTTQGYWRLLNPVYPLGTLIFFSLLHFAASLTHRCPNCLKCPTAQGRKPIHQNAVAEEGLGGWSRVVWQVLRNRPFICIHCGTKFAVH